MLEILSIKQKILSKTSSKGGSIYGGEKTKLKFQICDLSSPTWVFVWAFSAYCKLFGGRSGTFPHISIPFSIPCRVSATPSRNYLTIKVISLKRSQFILKWYTVIYYGTANSSKEDLQKLNGDIDQINCLINIDCEKDIGLDNMMSGICCIYLGW